jgi:hypothetical protein
MLIYLIIAAELAILYTVFWYVYVHEPKPYKFKKGLWGRYGDSPSGVCGVDPTAPFVPVGYESGGLWEITHLDYLDVSSPLVSTQYEQKGIVVRRTRRQRPSIGYRQYAQGNEPILDRVFDIFSRTIDGLNVKTP